jgi:hypothetical protein
MNNPRVCFLLAPILLTLPCLSASAQSNGPYLIRGEIHDSNSRPLPRARVCASSVQPGGQKIFGDADSEGRFTLSLTESGRYSVNSSLIPYRGKGVFYPFDELPPTGAQEVNLDTANAQAYVSITVPPKNGTLLLKVGDSSTHFPVEMISIQMCQAGTSGCSGPVARSETGVFKLHPPPLPLTLKILSDDYEAWSTMLGQNAVTEPGTTTDLAIELRRRREVIGKALTDAEKQPGLYLPPPIQLFPLENERFDRYPRRTTLRWDKVEGAVSYQVEVDYCQNAAVLNDCVRPAPLIGPFSPDKTPITRTLYRFDFVGAQPGRWRVWAIDQDGRAGFKSPWRMFSYSH